jgi:excisionase family DNA binding protein
MDRRTVSTRLCYRTDELAALTGFSAVYLQRKIRSGELVGFKLGALWVVRRESFEAWMAQQEARSMRLRKPAGRVPSCALGNVGRPARVAHHATEGQAASRPESVPAD